MEVQEHDTTASSQWSADEWNQWIAETVRRRKQVYSQEPKEMTGAYNREIGWARDYHGREILELLQNADDAGAGRDDPAVRVTVVLTRSGLCVANTGATFTTAGVESLMISDNSPKQFDRSHYIGNRGLGFRSILNWTSCPAILSGNLSVGFDREQAARWLEELACEYPTVASLLARYRDTTSISAPVPTLAVPFALNCPTEEQPSHENWLLTLTQARELRTQGYNTVIALPFTALGAFEKVTEQLKALRREALLFTNHIIDLNIRTPSRAEAWQVDRRRDEIEIHTASEAANDTSTWRIFGRAGRVPEDLLRPDQQDTPGFDLRIALPTSRGEALGILFSYFPTHVRFPFPVVAHATLELKNDRQQIAENDANRFVAHELADFLAETAERCQTPGDPWYPLAIVSATDSIDSTLEGFGFLNALESAARTRKLVPLRDGTWARPADAHWLGVSTPTWLPPQGFACLVPPAPDRTITRTMGRLNVPTLSQDEFSEALNRVSRDLSLHERAALIGGLLKESRLLPRNPLPNLLLDTTNDIIPGNEVVYFPPSGSSTLLLPEWLRLRMLHPDLIDALRSAYVDAHAARGAAADAVSQRDLVTWLRPYELREYALDRIVSTIVTRTNDMVETDPTSEPAYRRAALAAIFSLYTQSSRTEFPRSASDTHVHVPTRDGRWAPSNTVYFGTSYPVGQLAGALYEPHCPDLVVAPPDELQLAPDVADVTRFLRWLGVAHQPRQVVLGYAELQKNGTLTSFESYVLDHLTYPAKFEELMALKGDKLETRIDRVTSFDGIDQILKEADPNAILAWIASDERIERLGVHGDADGILYAGTMQMRKWRQLQGQRLPSYVTWLLARTPWLPTNDGDRRPPSRCILRTAFDEDVVRLLPRPAPDPKHPLFVELEIDQTRLRTALLRCGVHESLESISWDTAYRLLLELPQRDPGGEAARSLCRSLVLRSDMPEAGDANYQHFLQSGSLWGTHREKAGYFRVDHLHYADAMGIPQAVTSELLMLSLEKRRGSKKVELLFGVRPLRPEDVAIAITHNERSVGAAQFAEEVEKLKPFILVQRTHGQIDGTAASQLRLLNMELCYRIQGYATVEGQTVDFQLADPGQYILWESTAYIVAEHPDEEHHGRFLSEYPYADVIADVFAQVFGLTQGSDFALLAYCPQGQRLQRLSGLLSATVEDVTKWFKSARNALGQPLDDWLDGERPASRVWMPAPSIRLQPEEGQQDQRESDAPGTSPVVTEATSVSSGSEAPLGPVTVTQEEHTPRPPARRVSLRVSPTPGTQLCDSVGRARVDPARCQELAAQFEAAQGRFPLPVDYLQGQLAYGCDVLSFKDEDARERFQQRPANGLVERFIEVKGRASGDANVELRGNELSAAQEYHERYYLYRIYEREPGIFDVLTLSDPTEASTEVAVLVDLQRARATEHWTAVEHEEG